MNSKDLQRIFKARGVGQVMIVSGFLVVLLVVFQILNSNFLGPRNIPGGDPQSMMGG